MDGGCETIRSQGASPAPGAALSDALLSPCILSQPASPIPNLAHSDILTSPCTPAPVTPSSNEPPQVHEALSPPSLPERVADGVFLAGSAADITHRGRVRTSKSKQDDGCRRNADERQPLNNTELKQETKDSDEAKHTTSNKEKKKKAKKARHKQSNKNRPSPPPPPPPARNPALDMQPGLTIMKADPPISYVYPALELVNTNTKCLIGVVVNDSLPTLSKIGESMTFVALFVDSFCFDFVFR